MKLRALAFGLALCGSALSAPFSARAEPVTLKVAHFLPPTSPAQKQVIEPWCERLGQETGGQVKCQIFPAMQLGGTPGQLVDQVKNGIADVVWTAPGYSAGRFPVIEAMELPFVVRDALSGSKAAWAFYEQHARKEFDAYKVLAVHVDGGVAFHTAGRSVASPESPKGLKLRASTRMVSKTLAALGAVPVNMPPAQVTEAIAKGVVDGAMGAWEVVTPTKLHEVTKFHTDPPAGQPYYSTTVLALLMNKPRYEGLPADLKAAVDRNSGPALVEAFGRTWDAATVATRTLVLAQGGTITQQTPADYEAMRAAARAVEEEWVKDMTGKGIDAAALVAAARGLAAGR
ncbi:MAG TPA: TRAP transporter substrate-binding protein [Azospirillum sp.]|nr:TRAP transporter substrate-binding protein [Azospirillum sp.]